MDETLGHYPKETILKLIHHLTTKSDVELAYTIFFLLNNAIVIHSLSTKEFTLITANEECNSRLSHIIPKLQDILVDSKVQKLISANPLASRQSVEELFPPLRSSLAALIDNV